MSSDSEVINENYWRELLLRATDDQEVKYGFIALGKYMEAVFDTLIGMTGCIVKSKESRNWDILDQTISGRRDQDKIELIPGQKYRSIINHSDELERGYAKFTGAYRYYRNPLAHNKPEYTKPTLKQYRLEILNVEDAMEGVMKALKIAGGLSRIKEFNDRLIQVSEQAKPERCACDLMVILEPSHSLNQNLGPTLKNYLYSLLGPSAEEDDLIKYWDVRYSNPETLWRYALNFIASRCHSNIEPLAEFVRRCAVVPDLNDSVKSRLVQWLVKYDEDDVPAMSKIPTIGVRLDRDDDEVLRLAAIKLIEPNIDHFDKVNEKLQEKCMPIHSPNDLYKVLKDSIGKYLKSRRDLDLKQDRILLFILLPDEESAILPWHQSSNGSIRLEPFYRCIAFSHSGTQQQEAEWSAPLKANKNIKTAPAKRFKHSDFDDFDGLIYTELSEDSDAFKQIVAYFRRSYIGLFGTFSDDQNILKDKFITPEGLYSAIRNMRCSLSGNDESHNSFLLLNTHSSRHLEDDDIYEFEV